LDSLNKKWDLLKDKVKYVNSIKGLQSIKHFGSKSKSRFEVIFPITIEGLFEQYNVLLKSNQYNKLENCLKDYFNSNLYNPQSFGVDIDKMNERNYFNLCNYITDYAFAHKYLDIKLYYHKKAHLYRDISSIHIAKAYFEKDVKERNGFQCICYKNFINKHFPNDNTLFFDETDLPF